MSNSMLVKCKQRCLRSWRIEKADVASRMSQKPEVSLDETALGLLLCPGFLPLQPQRRKSTKPVRERAQKALKRIKSAIPNALRPESPVTEILDARDQLGTPKTSADTNNESSRAETGNTITGHDDVPGSSLGADTEARTAKVAMADAGTQTTDWDPRPIILLEPPLQMKDPHQKNETFWTLDLLKQRVTVDGILNCSRFYLHYMSWGKKHETSHHTWFMLHEDHASDGRKMLDGSNEEDQILGPTRKDLSGLKDGHDPGMILIIEYGIEIARHDQNWLADIIDAVRHYDYNLTSGDTWICAVLYDLVQEKRVTAESFEFAEALLEGCHNKKDPRVRTKCLQM